MMIDGPYSFFKVPYNSFVLDFATGNVHSPDDSKASRMGHVFVWVLVAKVWEG